MGHRLADRVLYPAVDMDGLVAHGQIDMIGERVLVVGPDSLVAGRVQEYRYLLAAKAGGHGREKGLAVGLDRFLPSVAAKVDQNRAGTAQDEVLPTFFSMDEHGQREGRIARLERRPQDNNQQPADNRASQFQFPVELFAAIVSDRAQDAKEKACKTPAEKNENKVKIDGYKSKLGKDFDICMQQ